MDRLDRLEEVGGLGDRHLEHFGDVLALVVHAQRVAVVALAVAHLAVDVHVGQEVHLDLDRAVARARLAAPALDVEAEPAGLVPAHLRLARLAEERADAVEDARVGRRVRARRAADRRLVDVHDLVEVVETRHPSVLAGDPTRTVQLGREHFVEDAVDQRRLARAAHPGDGGEHAERELGGDVLQIVLARADDGEHALLVDLAALLRRLDHAPAAEVRTRQRPLLVEKRRQRPGVDDLAALDAGTRPDVDDPVGRLHGLFVVLDDDERVPEALQVHERLDEAPVVALVQPDRRLVEHVQHSREPRPDLRRETDALRFAARQRPRGAAEAEVVQPHLDEEVEARADLAQHGRGDLRFAVGEFELGEVALCVGEAEA